MNNDGFIILDKDKGITSRKAGYIVSKIFNNKKFGHIGTLDPMAEGVLIIALGKATKTIGFINQNYYKEYLFNIKFGIETNTLDITGKIIKQNNKKTSKNKINKVLVHFIGQTKQTPPIFSAININGKRAFDLARKNISFKLAKRDVFVKKLELLEFNNDNAKFRVLCKKGLYVRSLANDIAKACNTIGTVDYIKRIQSDNITIDKAVKLDFLQNLYNINGSLKNYLRPIDYLLGDIPVIILCDDEAKKIKNGGFITKKYINSLVRLYNSNEFIGIGYVQDNVLKPKKII